MKGVGRKSALAEEFLKATTPPNFFINTLPNREIFLLTKLNIHIINFEFLFTKSKNLHN